MTEAPVAITRAISMSIGRCAESLLDVDRLRGETNALKAHAGELATFAGALFELECAKKGDPDARANMLDTADQLLQFWRDRTGDQLAAVHPTLSQLWVDASAMLISFEKKRIERALKACFESRSDAALLQQALTELTPGGDRRVEFATCLYHLELARLFVDSSRAEFARRIALVHEAYNSSDVAAELIGGDDGLAHLWEELVPYLDEFYEAQEQAEEKRRRTETDPSARAVTDPSARAVPAPTGASELAVPEAIAPPILVALDPTDPSVAVVPPPAPPMSDPSVPAVPPPALSPPTAFVPEGEMLNSALSAVADELEIVETRELTPAPGPGPSGSVSPPDVPSDSEAPLRVPPRLEAPPPPPPRTLSQDSEVEVIELEEAPVPPPIPKRKARDLDVLVDYEPDAHAQAFWRQTESALGLLPDSSQPRGGSRVLSADGRGERKKLNAWLDGLTGHFTEVPEARAMQCLMRLYMAAQVKEKTLFGQPNPKRKEAFKAALELISTDAGAVGRAAVWFELDGPETIEHLQVGLEVLQDFIQFCARQKRDPLDGAAADEFLGL